MTTPILFIDLETTGLSPQKNAPLSICVHVLGGPNHGAELHETMRPHKGAIIVEQALQVNGYIDKDIWSFPDPYEVYVKLRDFIDLLDSGQSNGIDSPHIGRMPLHIVGGWNLKFDEGFMRAWISRCAEPTYYGNTFDPEMCEVMNYYKFTYPDFKQRFGSAKLSQAYFGIFEQPIAEAHTARGDVLATRDIFLHCDKQSKDPQYSEFHHLIQ